jgi:hypothetical protein
MFERPFGGAVKFEPIGSRREDDVGGSVGDVEAVEVPERACEFV